MGDKIPQIGTSVTITRPFCAFLCKKRHNIFIPLLELGDIFLERQDTLPLTPSESYL